MRSPAACRAAAPRAWPPPARRGSERGGAPEHALHVVLTGASGLIGRALVAALLARGDQVTVLSRNPDRARSRVAPHGHPAARFARWDPQAEPAPADVLAGAEAVVHLAGESVAKRWSERGKRAIRDSRVLGTRNLVSGLRASDPRPRTLVSASASGYYGPHGQEPLDEETPPGSDFLAQVCVAWEAEAHRAAALGVRVALVRTGVVLSTSGGALAAMLVPFRLGLGGPVAGGRQFMPWIHIDDEIALLLASLDDERFSGPLNASAPEPVTNREFTRQLARALRRPALVPVPALALRAIYGEMAQVLISGARVLPARALVLGFEHAHPTLPGALAAALDR